MDGPELLAFAIEVWTEAQAAARISMRLQPTVDPTTLRCAACGCISIPAVSVACACGPLARVAALEARVAELEDSGGRAG